MTIRRVTPAVLTLLLAASAAFGMASEPRNPPPQSGFPSAGAEDPRATARQEAELDYARAYEDVGKAKKDLEDGKAKNAEKKFKRALERCERAVALDERYHEAWNLIGYTARKLGDYDKAFKAYDRCLAIKADYAPAREYLGEAWLEKGDPKKARDQMVWLERLGANEELRTLKSAYDAWVAAHPEASQQAAPAAADSTAAPGGTAGH